VTDEPKKRRPGRPAKGKRGNFTFRVTEKLREQLIARSEASGLSVSEEIERTLDQSINGAGIAEDFLGGPHTATLILAITAAIRMVEIETGKKWTEDHETNLAMKAAIATLLDLVNTPADDVDKSGSEFAALLDFLKPRETGVRAAVAVVKRVRKSQSHPDDSASSKELKS
jgi:hypothetical protein